MPTLDAVSTRMTSSSPAPIISRVKTMPTLSRERAPTRRYVTVLATSWTVWVPKDASYLPCARRLFAPTVDCTTATASAASLRARLMNCAANLPPPS